MSDLGMQDGAAVLEPTETMADGAVSPAGDHVQVAQADEPIGTVRSVRGTVTVQRADGSEEVLQEGDAVYADDLVQSGDGASVAIVFVDGTEFSLGARGEMVLDEMVYDPASGDGSASFNLLSGTFSFVSGQLAKAAPDAVTVKTPLATIGIRGTSGAIGIEEGLEGPRLQVVLVPDGDGTVGELSIITGTGEVFILNIPLAALEVSGTQAHLFNMSVEQFNLLFGDIMRSVPSGEAVYDRIQRSGNEPIDGDRGDGNSPDDTEAPQNPDTGSFQPPPPRSFELPPPPPRPPEQNGYLGPQPPERPHPPGGPELPVQIPDPQNPAAPQEPSRDAEATVTGSTPFDVSNSSLNWTVRGDHGDNIIRTGSGNDVIYGVGGNNVIQTNGGDDTVFGGTGNDVIIAGNGEGNDFYDGGGGRNWLMFHSATEGVKVHLQGAPGFAGEGRAVGPQTGIDRLFNIDNVSSGIGNDTLVGNSRDNILSSGGGNDTIFASAGNDVIDGGAGIDKLDYSAATGAVSVNMVTGSVASAQFGTDTVSGIERFVTGSGNDTFTLGASNLTSGLTIDGGAGSNMLRLTGSGPFNLMGVNLPNIGTINVATAGAVLIIPPTLSVDTIIGTDLILQLGAPGAADFSDVTLTGVSDIRPHADGSADDIVAPSDYGGLIGGEPHLEFYTVTAEQVEAGEPITITSVHPERGALDLTDLGNLEPILTKIMRNGDDLEIGFTSGAVVIVKDHFTTNPLPWLMDAAAAEDGAPLRLNPGTVAEDGVENLLFGAAVGAESAISGGTGDDTYVWQGGGGSFNGGAGTNDLYFAGYASPEWTGPGVIVDLEAGTAYNLYEEWHLTFTDVSDVTGTRYQDRITGDAENNWFSGYGGNDWIDGGGGYNSICYGWSSTGVDVYVMAGLRELSLNFEEEFEEPPGLGGEVYYGDGNWDTLYNIQHISGSDHDDYMEFYGFGVAGLALFGQGGNDTIGYSVEVDTLDGGDGFDTLLVETGILNLADVLAAGQQISNFEEISLITEVAAHLILSADAVKAISQTDTLWVTGWSGYLYTLESGWTSVGTAELDGEMYQGYTYGGATIYLHGDIQSHLTGSHTAPVAAETVVDPGHVAVGGHQTFSVADLAQGGAGIAVTGATGTWEYSLYGGEGWQTFDFGSGKALILDSPDAQVRVSGESPATDPKTLEFHLWDGSDSLSSGDLVSLTNVGGSTAYSAETVTAEVNQVFQWNLGEGYEFYWTDPLGWAHGAAPEAGGDIVLSVAGDDYYPVLYMDGVGEWSFGTLDSPGSTFLYVQNGAHASFTTGTLSGQSGIQVSSGSHLEIAGTLDTRNVSSWPGLTVDGGSATLGALIGMGDVKVFNSGELTLLGDSYTGGVFELRAGGILNGPGILTLDGANGGTAYMKGIVTLNATLVNAIEEGDWMTHPPPNTGKWGFYIRGDTTVQGTGHFINEQSLEIRDLNRFEAGFTNAATGDLLINTTFAGYYADPEPDSQLTLAESANFTNSGAISFGRYGGGYIGSGRLVLEGTGFTNNGVIQTVGTHGIVDIAGGGTFTNADDGTLRLDTVYNESGVFTQIDVSLAFTEFGTSDVSNAGDLTAVDNYGRVEFVSMNAPADGTPGRAVLEAWSLTNHAGGQIVVDANLHGAAQINGALINHGTVEVNQVLLLHQADAGGENSGTITISGEGVVEFRTTGEATSFYNEGDIVFQTNDSLATPQMRVAGGFGGMEFFSAATGRVMLNSDAELVIDGSFLNQGLIDLGAYQLTIRGGGTLTNSGNITGASGAVLDVSLFDGMVDEGGTNSFGSSPGTFTIIGNYTEAGEQTGYLYEIGGEEAGTGYDQLVIDGHYQMGGTLSVTDWDAFTPAAGDSFHLISATSVGGRLSHAEGLDTWLSQGIMMDARVEADGVHLDARAVDQQAGAGGETLTAAATPEGEVLVGGIGADTLIGGGGRDVLFGGEGDDAFVITDDAFGRIDGGAGYDTLRINAPVDALALDFTTIGGERFDSIEDMLLGEGAVEIRLDGHAVRGMLDEGTDRTLIVNGQGSDDEVVLSDGDWSKGETADGYTVYHNSQSNVAVQVSETVTVSLAG